MRFKTLCSLSRGKEALRGRKGQEAGRALRGCGPQPGRRCSDQGVAERRLVSRGRGRKLEAERNGQEEAEARGLSCCNLPLPEEKQMWDLTVTPDPRSPRSRGAPARAGGPATDTASDWGREWFSWKPHTMVRDREVPVSKPCLSFKHHWSVWLWVHPWCYTFYGSGQM